MLFTFPSRYLFTIGHARVLRLGGWSPHVQTGFHVSRLTRGRRQALPVRGCHPLWPIVPDRSGSPCAATGLVRFRSPLLSESLLMSFPPGTEMFQFPGFASNPLWIQRSDTSYQTTEDRRPRTDASTRALSVVCRLTSAVWKWVSPFGNPRLKACSQLLAAYRSVPRPSSPARTKASTERP